MSGFYFAYGSNMSSVRLRERVPAARSLGRAQLAGFRLAWNKPGRDGSGKANIVVAQAEILWGVLYEFPTSAWATLDHIERDYARETHGVLDRLGQGVSAELYRWTGEPDTPWQTPREGYRNHLVVGAREHDLPADVIEALSILSARP